MNGPTRTRTRRAPAVLAPLLAACALGCTPAEYGSLDMAKSKAIAAEKGLGPQPKAARKSRPNAMPPAPAPR